MESEELKKVTVSEIYFLFVKRNIIVADKIIINIHTHYAFNIAGIIICQCRCIRRRQVRYLSSCTVDITNTHHAVNILSVFMKIIVTEFIQDKKKNHETARNAYR